MRYLTSLLLTATCALSFASAAFAAPTYHVNLDTSGYAGQAGYLDFGTVGVAGAPGARASFSNLLSSGGSYGVESDRLGAVLGAIPGGFSLDNAPGDSYLTHAVALGGMYSFDVSFSGAYQTVNGTDGASFAIGLYNGTLTDYTLLARFDVQPGSAIEAASVTPLATSAAVNITQLPSSPVPEPASWAMMLTGLLLTGAMVRNRR